MKKPNDYPHLEPLSTENIRSQADEFRGKFWPTDELPVDIDLIIEDAGIQMRPLPRMRETRGIDACLSPDMGIWVTYDPTDLARDDPRTRFSLAHEVGHIVMHRPFFEWLKAKVEGCTVLDWVQVIREQSESYDASRIEKEADEFAGRLLVPPRLLQTEFDSVLRSLDADLRTLLPLDADAVRNRFAQRIHRRFGVSVACLEVRLRVEGVYPPH